MSRKKSSTAHDTPNAWCDVCYGIGYHTQSARTRSSQVPFPTPKVSPIGLWDTVKIKKKYHLRMIQEIDTPNLNHPRARNLGLEWQIEYTIEKGFQVSMISC